MTVDVSLVVLKLIQIIISPSLFLRNALQHYIGRRELNTHPGSEPPDTLVWDKLGDWSPMCRFS